MSVILFTVSAYRTSATHLLSGVIVSYVLDFFCPTRQGENARTYHMCAMAPRDAVGGLAKYEMEVLANDSTSVHPAILASLVLRIVPCSRSDTRPSTELVLMPP